MFRGELDFFGKRQTSTEAKEKASVPSSELDDELRLNLREQLAALKSQE